MSTEESKKENPKDEIKQDNEFEKRTDLSGIHAFVESVRKEVGKVIVGQQEMVDLLIAALLADGHVLIEGVPGVAKTLTTKLLAEIIDADFSRIQFTPDLMPADVIGTSIFNPKKSDFEFKQGPVFSNIVLIDEINRSPAKTQAALFEVMEEKQITVDGQTYKLEAPFFVVATQNPIEHEGTYRLPEAQLDRFLFKIDVPYPKLDEEIDIISGAYERQGADATGSMNKVLDREKIRDQRKTVMGVHVEKSLMKYIAEIIQMTRNSSSIYIGASPRASVFVMKAAQAWAAMQDRDFVIPDDAKAVIKPVLRHRITLTPEQEMEGVSTDKVIERLLEKVEVPR
jgi:MoxR-like ATPase